MPFVIPRMVSGPDYFPEDRWRRHEKAPLVSSSEFTRGFARRVESQCRNDWTAVPIVRSVHFKFQAEHTMGTVAPFVGTKGKNNASMANEYIEAAQVLQKQLWSGHTGHGVHRVPIRGDTTRLPFANDLTPLQRRLAFAMNFLSKHLAGTQQVRQLMGHTQFGARVNYGDCTFLTISPNEQHSALVLRLSRYRANDPYLWGTTKEASVLRDLAGREAPNLETGSASVQLPEYEIRRIVAARDPLAVIDAYKI